MVTGFEPWLFEYVGTKLADRVLDSLRNDKFTSDLQNAVDTWAAELPDGAQLASSAALFPSYVLDTDLHSRPKLVHLRQMMKEANAPTTADWQQALSEQWNHVRRATKYPQEFFILPEQEALSHLAKLSSLLANVCAQHEPLFRSTTLKILRELRPSRATGKATLSLSPAAPGTTVPIPVLLDELNQRFQGYLKVHAIASETPNLLNLGSFTVSAEIAALAKTEASRVKRNETHAVLEGGVVWTREPTNLHFRTTDYATVKVLRGLARQRKAHWPLVISVAGVIISADSREIYLHHKSTDTTSHGGLLHTPGGAFMPFWSQLADGDSDLEYTMQREALEEIRMPVTARNVAFKLLTEQYATNYGNAFIQVAFLGVPVLEKSPPEETYEGIVKIVSFEQLPDYLEPDSPLVPTGKANILAWLALGCPGCPGATFGDQDPIDLFRKVMASKWKPYGEPLGNYSSHLSASS